jgi:hypothetical protein
MLQATDMRLAYRYLCRRLASALTGPLRRRCHFCGWHIAPVCERRLSDYCCHAPRTA